MDKRLMILGLVALSGLLLLLRSQNSRTAAIQESSLAAFAAFQSTFGKNYHSLAEAEYRLGVFRANLDLIERHNADSTQTYTLGINQFADLTFEEFSALYLAEDRDDEFVSGQDEGLKLIRSVQGKKNKIDWRDKGVIGPVKNQSRCGSCWAFSAISVVEEAFAVKKNTKVVLSEQELIDCSRRYGNRGCHGGRAIRGLRYIRKNHINTQADYPYKAKGGECKPIGGKGKYGIKKWRLYPGGARNMVRALRRQPTTASLHVQHDFRFYKSGVYNPASCPGNRNHAVNAIGFDLESEIPHFIVRNSWGAAWGDHGFFRIAAKEGNGTCWFNGENRTTYPIL